VAALSKRKLIKMLRQMASGEPVKVKMNPPRGTPDRLSRLAFHAQQFGYEYADIRQKGGPQGAYVMLLVPDPSPQARARAAQNRARYPDAADGGALPPLAPEAVDLLKARLALDLSTGHSPLQLMMWTAFGGLPVAAYAMEGCRELGIDPTTALIIAGGNWVALIALFVPANLLARRRSRTKNTARLEAAGFTPVTDDGGRLRYVPPGQDQWLLRYW
jgi:hypothetical protein